MAEYWEGLPLLKERWHRASDDGRSNATAISLCNFFRLSWVESEKNSAQNRGGVCCFCVRVMVYSFRIISGIMKTKDVEPMDALDKARREIDTVDAALAALFERRMTAVRAVAE